MQSAATHEPGHELSPKTREVLAAISDGDLRRDVEEVVRGAIAALAALARTHLPQDQFEESDSDENHDAVGAAVGDGDRGGARDLLGRGQHVELAPYVLAALAAVNHLTDAVTAHFPPSQGGGSEPSAEDFDLEFDLVDGPTGEGTRLSVQKSVVGLSVREQVGEVGHAMAGMLRSRVASLGPRLRHALQQTDPWPLLSELDDYKHALTKGVQGLLFGVLGVFNDTARREEILPEYRSAVREAVDLRAAIADLAYHIGRFNSAISEAQPAELVPLVVGVADRLARFSARPEYRTLRAEDKRPVIDFRRTLQDLRHSQGGVPVVQLRHAVEGFSKFLEAMHSINHREVLVLHDNQRLSEALERLDESLAVVDTGTARGRLQGIARLLSSVMGRHPDLDQALRSFGSAAAQTDVRAELARWHEVVQAALATVG